MAKAGRKSTTARKRKRKHRKSEHKAAAPKAEPERALFVEKLGGHPPPPFVIRPLKPITVSAEQWAEMRRRAAEWQRGRRSIDRAAAIRDGLIRPPWMEEPAPAPAPAPAPQEYPGDDLGEQRARRFLYRLMEKHPSGLPGQAKEDFKRVCMRRFKISARSFDQLWDWAIDRTGATAFRAPGPKRPHASRSRRR
jgi:hypothetical protein